MKLDIIHHNVRHWGSDKNLLSNYYLQSNPDIITINSHGLDSTKGQFLKLFNYSNKTSGSGMATGAAILTKSCIKHTNYKADYDNNTLYTIIETNIGKIAIFTFYSPPRFNWLPLTDLQNVLNLNIPTIILTDANVKHTHFGHNNSDELGKLLYNFMKRNNLLFLGPNFKTFFSSTRSGKPDIVLGNTQMANLAIYITAGKRLSSSDHIPIHIQINSSPIAIPLPIPQLNYNRANWEGFRSELESIPLPKIQGWSIEELENNTNLLMQKITNAAKNNIPHKRYKTLPAFTPSTRTKKLQLIYNQRHELYKNNMTNQKSLILIKIKALIDKNFRADYDQYWQNQIKKSEDLETHDPKGFFKRIHNLMGTGPNDKGTFLKYNDKEITDPNEQSNIFAKVWENIFNPHIPNPHNREAAQNHENINNWANNNSDTIKHHNTVDLNRLNKNNTLTKPITFIAVKKQIHKIKSPANGPSGQNGSILKQLPNKTVTHITRIFN